MIVPILFALAAATSSSPGVDAYLAAEGIDVVKVRKIPRGISDKTWNKVPSRSLSAFPQRTLRLNDKKANGHLERGPTSITVQAIHDGSRLAVRLSWRDKSESRGGVDTASFGDAAAMEIPEKFGAGIRLPYIGMGDAQQRALVYLMRAFPEGSSGREYIGAGFGSLTRTKVGRQRGDLRYNRKNKTWTVLFIRPLNSFGHSIQKGVVPIAFAIWDGDKNERGGNKALTSWKTMRLEGYEKDAQYLKELSFGYGPGDFGDAGAGKAMVEGMCIACHHVGDKKYVPAGMAPNLVGIGNITTYSYLRDSIQTPGRVLVPNPNFNQHYQKSGAKDKHGALPNDPAYAWSVDVGGGKKASKMPPFPLPKDQIANIIAFLKPRPAAPSKESK